MSSMLLSKQQFSAQVIECQNAMFRTAKAILGSDEDAEDAVQEAICAAFVHRGGLRNAAKFRPWILRILSNKCYDILRKRRNTVDLADVEDYLCAAEPDRTEYLALWQAIMTLSDELRIVVTLFYYDGFSVREISEILGIREGAVKTRLFRGREQLRNLLRETVR